MKIERQRVVIKDSAKKTVRDKFGSGSGIFVPKKNKVIVEARNIKTGEIEETQTSNLILYHGRSWLMQRALGLNLGAVGTNEVGGEFPWAQNDHENVAAINRSKWSDMYINWFAAGTGGAEGADLLTPNQTYSTDYELADHLFIGGEEDGGENPSGMSYNLRYTHPADPITFDNARAARERDYHAFDPMYPQFLIDPDIVPDQGGTEDPNYNNMEISGSTSDDDIQYGGFKADSYLRALVRVTLAPEEYNGPAYYDPIGGGNEYNWINEAGLFVSPSHDKDLIVNQSYNQVEIFARTTFESMRKDDTRELVFSWYLYF